MSVLLHMLVRVRTHCPASALAHPWSSNLCPCTLCRKQALVILVCAPWLCKRCTAMWLKWSYIILCCIMIRWAQLIPFLLTESKGRADVKINPFLTETAQTLVPTLVHCFVSVLLLFFFNQQVVIKVTETIKVYQAEGLYDYATSAVLWHSLSVWQLVWLCFHYPSDELHLLTLL